MSSLASTECCSTQVRHVVPAPGLMRRLIDFMVELDRAHRDRHHLKTLSQTQLRDIGLIRDETGIRPLNPAENDSSSFF